MSISLEVSESIVLLKRYCIAVPSVVNTIIVVEENPGRHYPPYVINEANFTDLEAVLEQC